jgi:hypothetical protein
MTNVTIMSAEVYQDTTNAATRQNEKRSKKERRDNRIRRTEAVPKIRQRRRL